MCLRNNPLYHAGAVAFSVSAGIPKVGVLLESVWNMNDSCRFQLRSPESLKNMEKTTKTQEIKWVSFYREKCCQFFDQNSLLCVCVCVWIQRLNSFKSSLYIALTHRTESKPELVKTEMGPPPSPASTCSDTSSIASSASLPYSMSAPLLLFLSLNPKLSQQHSSLDFPLCLSGTKPISASLCALISPLTLKQMVRRLLSARFFPLPVCLWSEYGQLTVHTAEHLVAFLPLYHMNHTASCVDN